MDKKHYKKYLKQLVGAGISQTRIAKECDIDKTTVKRILTGFEPSERIKRKICDGYDKIVSNFISLD